MVQIFLVEMLYYIARLGSCSRVIHRAYDPAEPEEMVHNGFCYSKPHDLKVGTLCRAKTILTVHSVSSLSQFRCYFKSAKEMKHLAVPVRVHNVQHRTCVMLSIPQLKTMGANSLCGNICVHNLGLYIYILQTRPVSN